MTPEASVRSNPPLYEGIQAVDLTTAGHLFKPEDAFALVSAVNKSLASEVQMRLELYTTVDRTPLARIRDEANKRNLFLPIPAGVNAKDIAKWQTQYNVKVERVHLPFDYDNTELLYGLTKTKSLDPRQNRQIIWMMTFGGAKNMHGIKLAEQIEAGINAHANVITGLAMDGKLDRIKNSVPFVVSEVEEKHTTPKLGNPDAFGVPTTQIEQIVEQYGLNGILLGLDHMDQSVDIIRELQHPKVRQYTRALHIGGNEGHEIIGIGNEQFNGYLKQLARTPFENKVRAALDYNPLEMRKLSGNQQIELIKNTIIWIMRSQGLKDNAFIKK